MRESKIALILAALGAALALSSHPADARGAVVDVTLPPDFVNPSSVSEISCDLGADYCGSGTLPFQVLSQGQYTNRISLYSSGILVLGTNPLPDGLRTIDDLLQRSQIAPVPDFLAPGDVGFARYGTVTVNDARSAAENKQSACQNNFSGFCENANDLDLDTFYRAFYAPFVGQFVIQIGETYIVAARPKGDRVGTDFLQLGVFTSGYYYNGDRTIGWDTGGPVLLVAFVPEPGTWAMMLGGFGLLGAAARRRYAPLGASSAMLL